MKNRPEEALIIRVKDYTRIGKDREIGRIIVPASVWEEEQRYIKNEVGGELCIGKTNRGVGLLRNGLI